MSETLLSLDHPIEGPEWREREVLGFVFHDSVLQQILGEAAEMGEVFNSREIQAWRRQRSRIAPAADHRSSKGAVENPSEESGKRDTSAETQTTRASAVSAGPSEVGARARERMVEDNHDEDTETPSLLAVGLQTALGDSLEVVSSIKAGRHVSVVWVLRQLKNDNEGRTYDLGQQLGHMSANSVEIRTATIPRNVRQVAAGRDKWGDSSQLLGKLDEAEKMPALVPCIPSKEADEIRKFAGKDVSSSIPIFVLYFFETSVSGPYWR